MTSERLSRLMVIMGWSGDLIAWEDYLRAAGAPDTTIGQRLYHVGKVAQAIGKSPCRVTFDDLTRFLGEQHWAPNTRRAYRGSLRSFYAWELATGRVMSSPAHLLPPVKIPRGKPRPASEAAIATALSRADDRERLAILLAAVCGLRRGEIAKARREDVEPDLVGHSLRVIGKGGHTRMVPMPPNLTVEILEHPAGWLFPSPHGGHLTAHHLGKLVARTLPGDLTTHTLRHRCASVAYAATHDLRAVQELLGHAKPETTAIYTQVPDGAVRAAMDAAAA